MAILTMSYFSYGFVIFHPATKLKAANQPNAWRLLIYDSHESHMSLNVF